MTETARARPKILVAHQWKSKRGLYGADRVILRILRKLAPIARLIVVIESEGEFADEARALGCDVRVIDMGVLRRRSMNPLGLIQLAFSTLAGVWRLIRLISRERVDLVFTSTVPVLASGIAAKLTRRPHIWFIQELLEGKSRMLGPLMINLSDKIIAVSKASAESVAKEGPANPKIIVAYPGVDVRRFDVSTVAAGLRNGNPNEMLIAHVARIHYWKGQGYFLDALRELKNRGVHGFRALIVGEVYQGYEELRETLKQKVRTLGLETQVSFLGHRDDADTIFNAVDITVSPAVSPEPFGLVVVEAMAARKPVVATNLGGPAEIIENGVSGFLISANNVSEFADRLEQLIKDANLRERLGQAARQRVETAFSAEAFDREMIRQVESLLGKPLCSSP